MRSQHRSSSLPQTLVACLMLVVGLALQAQQQFVPAPHRPVEPRVVHPSTSPQPATLRSMIGGLWMTDPNLKSSIYLKNDVETDSVTVTPILYLSNGQRLTLPDVKLEPSGTAVVSINEALQQQHIAPWATLYGYVEVQYRWPWDALCVTIRNVDPINSLIFMYYLEGSEVFPQGARSSVAPLQSNVLEGLWWKQESGVTGFVALSNVFSHAVHAKIEVSDAVAQPIAERSVTISPRGTKLVNLNELGVTTSTEGGVRITWDGPSDGLKVNGGLKDQATGYSARLPLHFPPVASAQMERLTYAAVGLMSGAADPMMSFPDGTTFSPYAVVRNISDQPLSVTPILWWMEGSAPHSVRLPQVALPAYGTQSIDVLLQASKAGLKNYNGNLNLVLEADGKSRGLLMATGSVDQRNTYVFEVLPSAVVESVAKTVSYWSTGNGDDTMVTLWNPADEAQDFTFTLSFSGGHYRLPIRIEGRATRMFNVSEIIHNQIADAEGNIIPATIHEGSAEIAGSQGENQHILVAVDAATYNVQKATCGTFCITCQGAVNSWVSPNPFSVAVNGSTGLTFTVLYKSGSQVNDTQGASWTSSDYSIATVNGGLVVGVARGEVAITASDSSMPVYFHACYGLNTDLSCPDTGGVEATARGTVGQCFARLKYRSIGWLPFNHAFWWIQDAWGTQYIIDGGPQYPSPSCPAFCGYLFDWVVPGTVGHYPQDNSGDATWFDTGLSVGVCPQVDNLESYAWAWPQTQYQYAVGKAPNSNTFAHDCATAGGFSATAPPNAPGW